MASCVHNDCPGGDGHNSNDDDADSLGEKQHMYDIVNTMRAYKRAFHRRIAARRHYIASDQLSKEQRAKFGPYILHLAMLETAATHNQEILKLFVAHYDAIFRSCPASNIKSNQDDNHNKNSNNKDPQQQQQQQNQQLIKKPDSQLFTDRLNSVLNQLAREWTKEGEQERAASYGRILVALERYFPVKSDGRSAVKVLVPGSGLGRLPFEIARRGFSCQGNEFSLLMLFVANFVLNESREPNYLSFYPYIGQLANNLSADAALTRLTFPDVCPPLVGLPPDIDFCMTAGSFLDVYSNQEQHCNAWDAVTTCFFLDTAPNVLEYIELIESILKPGLGLWINFGPLMYHWADGGGDDGSGDSKPKTNPSVEPTYEMVHQLIEASGFEFVEEEKDLPAGYTVNPHSMLSYTYKCVFFVARKKKVNVPIGGKHFKVVTKSEVKEEQEEEEDIKVDSIKMEF